MTPDRMRAIDRWAGIPLCFLLTLILRPFRRPFSARPAPKRILFIELSEMGSAILADPAMRKAQRLFGADLYFVIFAKNAISLSLLGTIPPENIRTIRENSLFVLAWDTLTFLIWARRRRVNSVIDLELFSRFTALLSGLSGAANKVGFFRFHNEGLYRGNLLTHRVAYNPHIHIAKNFVALINALASPQEEMPYSKTVIDDAEITLARVLPGTRETETMRARITEALPALKDGQRILLFNPNASEMLPQRRWPAAHFAALARLTLERWPDAIILITGAASEAEEAERLRHAVNNPRIVNFAGRTKLVDLPLLYALSSLMVTNDSGPAHFAAVVDLPTIVLFGPETPKLYCPLGNTVPISAYLACSPCVSAANHRKTACQDPVCMASIRPEAVLYEMSVLLDKARD